MPAPPNTTAGTATDLASLPNTLTERVDDAGTTYTVWYKFTPSSSGVIGVWAFGDLSVYKPTLNTFSPDGVTPYLVAGALNVPIQIPVTSGVTYFFQVVPNGGNPTPANLTINAQWSPQQTYANGNLFINDDTTGFPASFLDQATGAVRGFISPFPNGESGEVLPPSGGLAIQDATGFINFYDNTFTLLNRVAYTTTPGDPAITSNQNDKFYVGTRESGTGFIRKYSSSGSLLQTWNLGAITAIRALAVNPAETVAYLTAKAGLTDSTISKYDLVNSIFLTDFAAAVAGYNAPSDLIVISSGNVVVPYNKLTVTADLLVKQYDSSGAVVNSHDYGAIPSGVNARACHALDDPNSFWLWNHNADGTNLFKNVKLSDFSDLASFTQPQYELGVYQPAANASPTRFGSSQSCPILVLRSTPVPAQTTVTRIIRRLRRGPHVASQGYRVFHNRFLLDLQPGIGNVVDPGKVPQVMLRWSNNGGQTWSNEHWMSAGELGHYFQRLHVDRLGQARDRVYEVVVSDPVAWTLIGAFLDVEQGTN